MITTLLDMKRITIQPQNIEEDKIIDMVIIEEEEDIIEIIINAEEITVEKVMSINLIQKETRLTILYS